MEMNCADRDRIFLDGSPDEWAAFEQHASSCISCREELEAWRFLHIAAQELRAPEDETSMWPRIAHALREEQARAIRSSRWNAFWSRFPIGWQTALAGACLLVVTVSAGWLYFARQPRPSNDGNVAEKAKPFLKEGALAEVERAEADYVKAINKLASEAKPDLENPSTPLMVSYREKLVVLDSAIDELRAEAGENPSNAHLRRELLAMYQQKEETLEDILEEKR